MPDWFGVGGGVIAIAIAMALCLGILILLRSVRQLRGADPQGGQTEPTYGRLSLVESTAIDAQRSLVLVRCDNAEHLIMIGGPTDIVIDNDVHGSRNRHRPVSAAMLQAEAEPARAALATPLREGAPVARTGMRDVKPLPPVPDVGREPPSGDGPQSQDRLPAAQRPVLSAVPAAADPAANKAIKLGEQAGMAVAPAGQARRQGNGDIGRRRHDPQIGPQMATQAGLRPKSEAGNAAGFASEDKAGSVDEPPPDQRGNRQPGGRANRDEAGEPKFGKRENGNQGRGQQGQQPPLIARRNEDAPRAQQSPPRDSVGDVDRRVKNQHGPDPVPMPMISAAVVPPPVMPKAEVPWPEPDSIECEIVKALASDPQPPRGDATPQSAGAAMAGIARQDPSLSPIPAGAATTLGDLAERLEEALAREVRAAKHSSQGEPDFDLDQFNFDRERPTGERQAEPQASPRPAPLAALVPSSANPAAALQAAPSSSAPSAPATPPADMSKVEREGEPRHAGQPAPGPDSSRNQGRQERQDEAPVINLSERRRDAPDPLEDEMARLLGELAGDPTGRR